MKQKPVEQVKVILTDLPPFCPPGAYIGEVKSIRKTKFGLQIRIINMLPVLPTEDPCK